MSTKIIVDSTFDLIDDVKKRVSIVPLTIHFGDTEYVDGIDITREKFYEKLVESDVLPTTSQATPYVFKEVFDEIVNNGDDIVAITVSSTLSGTYQSAMIAAGEYPGKVHIVDSKSVAIGGGILAERALELLDSGLSAEQIAAALDEEKEKITIIALLDTLEYLKRGGRISKTVAFAGGVLAIKPVICVKDGEIKILGKARGSKQGNNLLNELISSGNGVNFEKPVLLGYTGMTDVMLKKYIDDSEDLWKGQVDNLNTALIGSVIGTHVGPGAVAAAYFEK